MKYIVPGNPIPWARPRRDSRHGNRWFTAKRVEEHIECIRLCADQAMASRDPLEGPLKLEVRFYREDKRRVDLDNLIKAVKDAMLPFHGWPGVYQDDSQVTTLHAIKRLDPENPRTEVHIQADEFAGEGM